MKTKFMAFLLVFAPFSPAVAGEISLSNEGLGTYASTWTGGTPPAALVRFKGQSLDSKAYVLGCGHCNEMPVGGIVANQPVSRNVYLHNSEGQMRGIPVTRIVFGTQTGVDLVLLEAALSYREIEDQFQIRSREVSENPQLIGTAISFYNLEQVQNCQIDETPERYIFNEQGTDFLLSPYIYYGCISLAGHSGSILVARETNEVVGLNVGGTSPEVRNGHIINYGSSVFRLYSCLNSQKFFDLATPGCLLQ